MIFTPVPPLAEAKVASIKESDPTSAPSSPSVPGKTGQYNMQHVAAAQVLKAVMDGFVARMSLWLHVPLCTRIENQEYSFENLEGVNWLTTVDIRE